MLWIELIGCALVAIGLLAWISTRGRRRDESENLALVRRRRALRDELQRLVPDQDQAGRLVLAAAKRLGVSGSSPEALQAAIEQGSRRSDSRLETQPAGQ